MTRAIVPGTQFNRLTLIRPLQERRRGARVGVWKCECGTEKHAVIAVVSGGHLKSCGCLRRKHGFACRDRERSAEYVAWQAMRSRCRTKTGRDYEAYGARGIGICERWETFQNFMVDMGSRPSPLYSVGRIDNNLGYSPSNCRWETPKQQQTNRRRSIIWHIKGLIFSSSREAASHFDVDPKTVRTWVAKGKEGSHAVSRY